MNRGIGAFLWQISVGLYLLANGVMGIQGGGDFATIYKTVFGGSGLAATLAVITGVIAIVAGIAVIIELFGIQLSFLDTLLLILAIVWAIYFVLEIISWTRGAFKGKTFFHVIQPLAVHLMVLGSLLTASKKFNR